MRALDGTTCGSESMLTPNIAHISGLQRKVRMSNSMVRDALETSVANAAPPVRRWMRNASIVAKAKSGLLPISVLCNNHSIFEPEKYGSSTNPVVERTTDNWSPSMSQRAAVRRSCQTIARWSGSPVRRLKATTVSRWLVMPIAAIGSLICAHTDCMVARTACQISSASCSTQPGCG